MHNTWILISDKSLEKFRVDKLILFKQKKTLSVFTITLKALVLNEELYIKIQENVQNFKANILEFFLYQIIDNGQKYHV